MRHQYPHIPLLAALSFASGLFPVAAGWIRWKSNSKEMKILLGLFSFYIWVFLTTLLLIGRGLNTVWLGQIYTLIEYTVCAIVFASWCKTKRTQTVMKVSIFFYFAVWMIAKFSFERLTPYATFTDPLEALLLAAMGVYTLIALLGEEGKSMLHEPRFWVSAAIILYSVGTLPVFALANKLLTRSLEEFARVWSINWTLIIIANTLYAIAFLNCHDSTIASEG